MFASCRDFYMTTLSVDSAADVISWPTNTNPAFCSRRRLARPVFPNFISIVCFVVLLGRPLIISSLVFAWSGQNVCWLRGVA